MDIDWKDGLTLEKALQMIFDDDADVDEVFIEPPESNILTDEDSADEDEAGLVDNLSGQQLSALAEVKLRNKDVDALRDEMDDIDNEYNKEEENVNNEEDKKSLNILLERRPGLDNISWISGDIIPRVTNFPTPDFSKYEKMSNLDIFESMIDEEIIGLLVDESTKYALFLNHVDPKITRDEIKIVIAILILTGYNVLPGKDFYWDSGKDMRNTMVSEAIRRDRFRQIIKYLHCADNTKPNLNDKLWKLRPLCDKFAQNFLLNWIPEEHLDFDESMIKYFGRHSCKQFIRGKPIRFGYKMWCLNTSVGYLVNFDMYQGKNPRGNETYKKEFGKCSAPFVNMIDQFDADTAKLPFKFYTDNLFTSFKLLYYLKQRGYDGTGTIRENRIPKSCAIQTKKDFMKKNSRGTYSHIIDKEDGIIVLKWLDNNVVSAASTCHGAEPTSLVKRFSQQQKKIIKVNRPSIIAEYNNFMGGTDLMDENISRYRIAIRRKKWWWPIFTWLLDVAVVNAWQIIRKCKNRAGISQLNFRREIVQTYLTRYGVCSKGAGRPSISKSSVTLNRVSDELRYDRLDHLLVQTNDKKRRRCAGEGCASSVRTMCSKCNVGLCLECNSIFHSN